MFKNILFILILTLVIAGCTAQSVPTQNDQGNQPTRGSDLGSIDDLINQLRASSMTVEHADSVEQAFFSVPGQKLLVNGHELQVFVYGSGTARQAESGQISKDGSSIGTTMVGWIEPPHFWANGSLIVLYVGNNQEVVDMVSKVIGDPIAQP